jgi:hypothetical protein
VFDSAYLAASIDCIIVSQPWFKFGSRH